MSNSATVIENQIFIGVPWQRIRPQFEDALENLKDEYPVHWIIFGRNTTYDAQDLWGSIKIEIDRSASTIFDLTGSNANVALEFGYAEALGKRRLLTLNKARNRQTKKKSSKSAPANTQSIMSDLSGKIHAPYRSVITLERELRQEFDRNPYVVRYRQVARANRWRANKKKVAIAITQHLAGGKKLSRPNLTVAIETEFSTYKAFDFKALLDQMNGGGLIVIKRGKHGGVTIPVIKD
ncbi:MAG: hypothetical protein JKY43_05000 [Phycisphaerales bacterium]|nr:hypothetical protein [Phycisphaerales bacterium]